MTPPICRRTRPARPLAPFARLAASLLVAGLLTAAGALTPAAAQEIHLAGTAGESLSDADLAQGVTIVVVWASWSPRSRDVVERVIPLADHWRARAHVLTVDFQEDRAAVMAFLAGRPMGAPVFLDREGAFSKKYAIATLPGLLVLKDGKTLYHGRLPDDPDRVVADLLR